MKIVIAPDSFKENLTSLEVASEIETGIRRVWPDAEVVKVPMGDGGEGTVQALVDATGGQIVKCQVTAPLGNKVMASYGLLGGGETAIIEMAEASGLPLVPRDKRNPLAASTFGVGELIADALNRGVEEIIIGLGGSATNDGGAGMAQALGVQFLDSDGGPITDHLGGGRLNEIAAINMRWVNPALGRARISVACDVTNPLVGEKGASRVYGPQKGATPIMVEALDKNLAHFATIIRRDIGVDVSAVPGGGAAGGMGAGLIAFSNATLKRGVELVVCRDSPRRPHAGRRSRHHGRRPRRLPDRVRQDAVGRCGVRQAVRRAGGGDRRRPIGRRQRRLPARHRRPRIRDAERHGPAGRDPEIARLPAGCRRARCASDHDRPAHGAAEPLGDKVTCHRCRVRS